MAPTVSQLVNEGIIEAKICQPNWMLTRPGLFLQGLKGLYLLRKPTTLWPASLTQAKKAKEEGKEKVILFNWSGHGLIDLTAYDKYFAGELNNFVLTEAEMLASEKVFENFPKPQMIKNR